jgi:hypothetical protein
MEFRKTRCFRSRYQNSIPEEQNDMPSLYVFPVTVWTYAADSGADPLLMNAFNNVNLSGSCILTSTEYAKELGVSESQWIYPLGGAGTQDSDNCMSPGPV